MSIRANNCRTHALPLLSTIRLRRTHKLLYEFSFPLRVCHAKWTAVTKTGNFVDCLGAPRHFNNFDNYLFFFFFNNIFFKNISRLKFYRTYVSDFKFLLVVVFCGKIFFERTKNCKHRTFEPRPNKRRNV